MKIVDTFIFYNEIELLTYRLSILDKYVDYFIIVESPYTFTGKPKPLHYLENIDKFSEFNHKIIHISVDDIPFIYPNINFSYNQQWQNEYFQRNAISRGIDKINSILSDTDVIITSDLDEIPNPKILEALLDSKLEYDKNGLNRLELDMYYYNLNLRVGDGNNWHGIKLINYNTYKNSHLSFQDMRIWEHTHHVNIIKNGGWHLSYFGDIDFIIKKIDSFSHQEFNNKDYIDRNILKYKLENKINLVGGLELQYIKIEDNKNLPPEYNKYLSKYILN